MDTSMDRSSRFACPNCGANKFLLDESLDYKCEYCGSIWKMQDILSEKRLDKEYELKKQQNELKAKGKTDRVNKLIQLFTNIDFVGPFSCILIVVLALIFFLVIILNSGK